MKKIDSIPTGKIERMTKLAGIGLKVGVNYAKYYGEKLIKPSLSKDKLHADNAEDIYDGLKELKGSALKIAQMLSMEKNIMPQSYVDKFSLSQFSVPPLSAPLVVKTFKKYFKKSPQEIFDTFSAEASHAASIGQVHQATKNGQQLAVKIQYPGIAESISSDIALVKPVAIQMFNLQGTSDEYFDEIEDKLIEETNYSIEMQQSIQIKKDCAHLPHLIFPNYYPEYSCEKIISMDWVDGLHLSEFYNSEPSQTDRNKVGQTLWDFYMFQIHGLKKFHADPHPGNFLVTPAQDLVAIDFGCMKGIPDSFYTPYFELSTPEALADRAYFNERLYALEILKTTDTPAEVAYFSDLFHQLLSLFTQPLLSEDFDFSQPDFQRKIAELGEQFSNDKNLRKMNGNRGSRHFIYVNRTFFGLYTLMFDLKSNIKPQNYVKYLA